MNIIDTLKRAVDALDRASKVMDPEAQAFQDRALADLRGAIAELESAELPDEVDLSPLYMPPFSVFGYTRDQMLAFRAAGRAEHVGDSSFESWYSTYNPANKGDKQRAREAYAAGMVGGASRWATGD